MALCCFANGSLAREEVAKQVGLGWDDFARGILDETRPGNGGNLLLPYFVPEITPRAAGRRRRAGSASDGFVGGEGAGRGRPGRRRGAGAVDASSRRLDRRGDRHHPGHRRRLEEPGHPAGPGRRLPGRDPAADASRTPRPSAGRCAPRRPSKARPWAELSPGSQLPIRLGSGADPDRRAAVGPVPTTLAARYERIDWQSSRRDSPRQSGRDPNGKKV